MASFLPQIEVKQVIDPIRNQEYVFLETAKEDAENKGSLLFTNFVDILILYGNYFNQF